MRLELKVLGEGISKIAKCIASAYVLPSALKVSEWPIRYPYILGENVVCITIGGIITSTLITLGSGSLALATIAERPDLTSYLALGGVVSGALPNVVSGVYEYGKILEKKRRGKLGFSK